MDAAIGHLDSLASLARQPFLAADVGGTHTRVALMRRNEPNTSENGIAIPMVPTSTTRKIVATVPLTVR